MIRPQVRSQIRPPTLPQRRVLAQAVARHFTELDASAAQYYEFVAPVTVTRIVMTVWSSSGDSTGLPGSPSLTPGVLQTLDYSFSGVLSYIGRVGNQYFNGIIADVKIWSGSGLVVDLLFNGLIPDNGVITNRAAGNPGAPSNVMAINLLPQDSIKYKQVDDGWLGSELLRGTDFSTGWSIGNESVVNGGELFFSVSSVNNWIAIQDGVCEPGRHYRVSLDRVNSDWIYVVCNGSSAAAVPESAVESRFSVDVVAGNWANRRFMFRVIGVPVEGRIKNPSLNRLITVGGI